MRLLSFVNILRQSTRLKQRPRWIRPYLRDLYYRRLDQGPEPYRPRSAWPNWDWSAESGAFTHRINEPIPTELLTRILTDKSFVNSEEGGDPHNETHADTGKQIAQSCILAFLRSNYPRSPEEWLQQITTALLSDSQLAFTASNLGLKDILRYSNCTSSTGIPLTNEPPTLSMLANALCAVVGALAETNVDRALLFVRDFFITPLVDLDLTGEIIQIEDPIRLLSGVLAYSNRPQPEYRLQNQCSMNNLTACFQVGVYCDRQLLGEAPGETLEIAQQEAASQTLRNLFGFAEHRPPLPFSGPLIQLDISPNATKNVSLEVYWQAAEKLERLSAAHA